MKNVSVILLVLLFASVTLAGSKTTNESKIEDNLLVGLSSDNIGLKTSAAYYLGKYGTSKSINSLLKVLKSGETEEERISAAVALTKINTEQTRFAVKQRAKFDDSARVRRLCGIFHNKSLQNN